ncbi:MAG TPA: hypothetical protein VMV86_01050 [Methanosarcinales archaeon]|nr:hypothetical protein [Methanosarcinales archaeon]
MSNLFLVPDLERFGNVEAGMELAYTPSPNRGKEERATFTAHIRPIEEGEKEANKEAYIAALQTAEREFWGEEDWEEWEGEREKEKKWVVIFKDVFIEDIMEFKISDYYPVSKGKQYEFKVTRQIWY